MKLFSRFNPLLYILLIFNAPYLHLSGHMLKGGKPTDEIFPNDPINGSTAIKNHHITPFRPACLSGSTTAGISMTAKIKPKKYEIATDDRNTILCNNRKGEAFWTIQTNTLNKLPMPLANIKILKSQAIELHVKDLEVDNKQVMALYLLSAANCRSENAFLI